MSRDPLGDFLAFCRSVGLPPVREPDLPDGQLVRYRSEGDKSGARNAWAVLHLTPSPWGIVGSWKTGEQHAWRPDPGRPLTARELAAQRRQAIAARAAREAERQAVQASARERVNALWRKAAPPRASHGYLQSKRVRAFGLRQLGDALMVPLRDGDGVLWNAQWISPSGQKRFTSGGRVSGLYHAIGQVYGRIIVAEGYATAATLHEATGDAVACAFSAGNLLGVCVTLRRRFPSLQLVVAADDDAATDNNPGIRYATEAARAAGALLAVPGMPL